MQATRGRIEGQAAGAARTVVDDLEPYLVAETIPRVLDALAPQLADELVPEILERLRPYLEEELVPAVIDGLMPHLVEVTAPQIVDGLMPKIRAEIVPAILDDIVDDPRVRELIREQSQGLVLDAVESFRQVLARGDDLAERTARRLRRARPIDVVEAGPHVPVGRRRAHAGLATRAMGLAIDIGLVAFLATQGLAALLSVIGVIVDPVPTWLVVGSSAFAGLLMPAYLALSWWLAGRSLGGLVAGYGLVRSDGRRLGPFRALVRATAGLALAPLWVLGMLRSSVDPARRGWLDLVVGTRTPYRVHESRRLARVSAERDHDLGPVAQDPHDPIGANLVE